MKKIILILLLVPVFANAQELPKLKLSQIGVEPIVVSVEGMTAEMLYNKTLNWIQETYKDPEHVLKAKIENEKIRIEAVAQDAWSYKIMGMKQTYNMIYYLEISFKDGKYKLDYQIGEFLLNNGDKVFFGWKDFYKKNGEVRNAYSDAIPSIENTMNYFSLNYFNYVSGVTTKKESNW